MDQRFRCSRARANCGSDPWGKCVSVQEGCGGGGKNRYAPNVRVRSLSRMGIDGIESEWGTSFKVNNRYVCRA